MPQRPQAPYLFPEGARLGTDNVVLHARATHHRVEGYAGPLSVKTVLSGRVAWIIRARELIVDRSSILILSAGETYSMNIAALKPVETCCAFFAPGFVERVALDMTSPLEQGLNCRIVSHPSCPTFRLCIETPSALSQLACKRSRNAAGVVWCPVPSKKIS